MFPEKWHQGGCVGEDICGRAARRQRGGSEVNGEDNSSSRGILVSRKAQCIAAILFLWLGVLAERQNTEKLRFPDDVLLPLGCAFAVFVAISIVLRSPSRLDRVV